MAERRLGRMKQWKTLFYIICAQDDPLAAIASSPRAFQIGSHRPRLPCIREVVYSRRNRIQRSRARTMSITDTITSILMAHRPELREPARAEICQSSGMITRRQRR